MGQGGNGMGSHREKLQALIEAHGDTIPLDLAAALIAAEEQGLPVDPAQLSSELDTIAAGAHVPEGASAVEAVARLNHRLFTELGFKGDSTNYDDPKNSFIDQVLLRRRGLPILLSVLYIEVARRVGVKMVGVGFPSHYLVRPTDSDFFIDPFHGGQVLRPEQLRAWLQRLYRGAPITKAIWAEATVTNTPRDILVRINRNLKFSHLRRDDLPGAVRASERLLLLAPQLAEERRDLGRMLIATGRVEEGVGELAHYLADRPTAPDAWQLAQELSALLGEDT
jgi:regulator of sirC expression with transglutaminase-like and TPR domain